MDLAGRQSRACRGARAHCGYVLGIERQPICRPDRADDVIEYDDFRYWHITDMASLPNVSFAPRAVIQNPA